MRGNVSWVTNEQQLLDTQSGTGGALPHMSQVVWHFAGSTIHGSRKVVVDGVAYYVGHGDPGQPSQGEYHNCLIDSLRQCVDIHSDRRAVRADLMRQFAQAIDRAKVTFTSYLDVELHWQSILQSLFKHNRDGLNTTCNFHDYCVIASYVNEDGNVGNGVVLGNVAAPIRLVVLNYSDTHFDPCLRLSGNDEV